MTTRVEVSIEGLTAIVPVDGGKKVHLVLPNGWAPRVTTDGKSALPPHCAYISYDRATAAANSATPHVIIPQPDEAVEQAFHFLRGVVIELDGQEGSSLTLDTSPDKGVKEWVAPIDRVSKGAGKINPDALKGTSSKPEIVAGCAELGNGTLTTRRDLNRKWKLDGKEVSLAVALVLEYEIEGDELSIDLREMSGANLQNPHETIVLQAVDGVIELNIGNDPLGDLLDHAGHPSHRHFEIYYVLSDKEPDKPYDVLEPAGHHPPAGNQAPALLPSGFCGPPVQFEE